MHFRNLETLRLAAAGSVIFSHAFLIVDGNQTGEPLFAATGAILGGLGVAVFFIISGILVAQSFQHSRNVIDYGWRRFLRIYPGYFVSILVVGALIAPLYWVEAPSPGDSARYAINAVLLRVLQATPNVEFYPGGVGDILNGSLWSIPVEAFCYVLIAALGAMSLLRVLPTLMLFVGGTVFLFLTKNQPESYVFNLAWGIPPFAAGMLMFLLHSRLHWRPDVIVIAFCCVALVAAGAFRILEWAAAMPLAILILALATSQHVNLGNASKFGDFSFGTYLYGWPIEQVVRATLGPINPWLLTGVSLPLAVGAGALSWHFVEKHALRLKPTRIAAAV